MPIQASDNARNYSTSSGITNRFVNTIITALQAPEWEILLQRIGADAMLHLLLKTSVFISLPNQCLCQLTGEALIYIPLPSGSSLLPSRSTLRPPKRKLESPGVTLPRKRQKLVLTNLSGVGPKSMKTVRQVTNQPIAR
ncbi:hypothetical protein J3A83DRAFT_4101147 [Scleroderma citrinum]